MKTATCIHTCFQNQPGIMYEQGRVYEVDEKNPWVQAHFDVPKTKDEPKK